MLPSQSPQAGQIRADLSPKLGWIELQVPPPVARDYLNEATSGACYRQYDDIPIFGDTKRPSKKVS